MSWADRYICGERVRLNRSHSLVTAAGSGRRLETHTLGAGHLGTVVGTTAETGEPYEIEFDDVPGRFSIKPFVLRLDVPALGDPDAVREWLAS